MNTFFLASFDGGERDVEAGRLVVGCLAAG